MQQGRQGQKHHMGQHRDAHRKQQPRLDRGGVLDLEGVEHHAGRDEVDEHHREHPAVRRFQQPGLDHRVAHQQNEEQLRDLLHE